MTLLENFSDTMPPRRNAWYNQAEAYFCLHGVTDRMFWFYYVQWALTPVQKTGKGYPIHPGPASQCIRAAEVAAPAPIRQGREGPLQEAAEHAAPWRQASVGTVGRDAAAMLAGRRGRQDHPIHVPVPADTHDAVNVGEDDTSSIIDLATRADALMDAEVAKDHAVVAKVEEATVAAAGMAPPLSARKRKPDWGKNKKPASKKNKGDGDRPDPGPWQDLGICWSHYTYGDKAKKCSPPCARAEN